MTDQFLLLKDHLAKLYSQNPFVTLLQIEIVKLQAGTAELSMPVISNKHTNLYNMAHGGALASLADTAMGMACATTGKKVVTLDMNLNYIRSAECQQAITAAATLIHNGNQTMVAETDIFDGMGNLLVKARATFFVTGSFL
ncbi:PaaI family thioesterase [Sporomusa malonica]|uniref:Acyl-CoA thioesterase n=1 Tax=Sporomusa malonica TaxID=112901 RepID=A0A1W2ER78_9FIRM|nr:PaaI family thioesterase [Sporomusa malonica]SMD12191.1 acyl-CoA thioesterase [Sporomusa malonica]